MCLLNIKCDLPKLLWLCLSGIVSRINHVENVKKPLENYRDIDSLKIYISDIGLHCID